MQSLVPRAIAIIEFGTEGDNCAVAKYKTTKMADKRSILAVNSIFLALASLAAVFQCCGFLLSYPLIEKRRQERMALQVAAQYNVAMRRMRHVRRRAILSPRENLAESWSHRAVAKDAFRFPCELFDFSRGKPSSISFRVERLSTVLSSTTYS